MGGRGAWGVVLGGGGEGGGIYTAISAVYPQQRENISSQANTTAILSKIPKPLDDMHSVRGREGSRELKGG